MVWCDEPPARALRTRFDVLRLATTSPTLRHWIRITLFTNPSPAHQETRNQFNGSESIADVGSHAETPTAFAYHIGLNREAANAGVPIYLRLLGASLAQSIAFGCERLSFGRTALEPKAPLGCAAKPPYV